LSRYLQLTPALYQDRFTGDKAGSHHCCLQNYNTVINYYSLNTIVPRSACRQQNSAMAANTAPCWLTHRDNSLAKVLGKVTGGIASNAFYFIPAGRYS